MKKIIVIILIIATPLVAQMDRPGKGKKDFGKRFETLEKIKLLETLNLDEDIAIKFFARRNLSRNKIKEFDEEKENIIKQMESSLENKNKANYNELVNKLLGIEEQIFLVKKEFIKSLDDILTEEQIVKVMLFEQKFKRNVRDLLIERGRKKFFKEHR